MKIELNLSELANTRWWEIAIRFLFGGAVTVATGLLAQKYGPVFGGLFLAFPAIFPASATLVEKKEREKKQKAGIGHTVRGREAAALDAKGAAFGALGLLCFGWFVWKLLPRWNAGLVLVLAAIVWLGVAIVAWRGDKALRLH